jgi:hypothetical protein
MPCLVGCIALLFPRVALFLVWLLGGNYLERAYEHWLFPLLGFLFLPLTTLVFAFGMNSLGAPNQMEPLGWVLVAVAAAADLGLIGRGAKDAQGFRDRDHDGWRRPRS